MHLETAQKTNRNHGGADVCWLIGSLKDTLIAAPFSWKWNETAFMKHTLETKIYDQEGNSTSSGEMTFFIFHNPLKFK